MSAILETDPEGAGQQKVRVGCTCWLAGVKVLMALDASLILASANQAPREAGLSQPGYVQKSRSGRQGSDKETTCTMQAWVLDLRICVDCRPYLPLTTLNQIWHMHAFKTFHLPPPG